MKIDHKLAEQWISPNSRVLDLGCGNGDLLYHLQSELNVFGYGIEMDNQLMNQAIAKGVNIIEQDLNSGLSNFDDASFDTVVMARTLQAVQNPDKLLLDMLRVGKQVIVTFPNFANWQNRIYLGLKGKMPVSKSLPYAWYNTPNIHLSTLNDFEQLCLNNDIKILNNVAVLENKLSKKLNFLEIPLSKIDKKQRLSNLSRKLDKTFDNLVKKSPNLLADLAIYRVSK